MKLTKDEAQFLDEAAMQILPTLLGPLADARLTPGDLEWAKAAKVAYQGAMALLEQRRYIRQKHGAQP